MPSVPRCAGSGSQAERITFFAAVKVLYCLVNTNIRRDIPSAFSAFLRLPFGVEIHRRIGRFPDRALFQLFKDFKPVTGPAVQALSLYQPVNTFLSNRVTYPLVHTKG